MIPNIPTPSDWRNTPAESKPARRLANAAAALVQSEESVEPIVAAYIIARAALAEVVRIRTPQEAAALAYKIADDLAQVR